MSLKVKENDLIKNVAGSQEVIHSNDSVDNELNSFSKNPIEGSVIKETLDSIEPTFDKGDTSELADFDSSKYITSDELNTIQESRDKLASDLNNRIKARNDLIYDRGYLKEGSNVTITNDDENTIVRGDTSIYAPDFRNAADNELSITSPHVFMLTQNDVDYNGIIMEHFGCFSVDKLRKWDRFDFYVSEDIYVYVEDELFLLFGNVRIPFNYLPIAFYNNEASFAPESGSPYSQFASSGTNVVNLAKCMQEAYPKHSFSVTDSTKSVEYAYTLANAVSFWMWDSASNYRVVSMQPKLNSLINGRRGQVRLFATKGTAFTLIYDNTNNVFKMVNNPLMVNIPFYKTFFCDDSHSYYIYDETISGYLKYRADGSWSFDGVLPTTIPTTARSSTATSNRWRLFLPIASINWNKTVEINGNLGVNNSATSTYSVNNRQARASSSLTADREALMKPDENYEFITNRTQRYSNTKVISLRGKL